MKVRIVTFLIFASSLSALSQDIPIYTQYFANPYLYNPAYAGYEGRPAFSVANRRQWVGIEDAPVTYNFTFHTPVVAGFNLGVNVTQDNYGIFQSNSALLTFGYTVNLGFNHFVSFGISGGVGNQQVDYTNINVNDPALANVLDQNLYLDGNAGLAYHIAGLNIGVALPRVFNTRVYPVTDFDTGELDVLRNVLVTADYMIYFGPGEYAFQPYGLIRLFEGQDSQFEGGGIFHIKNTIWAGVGYRQDFGIAGLFGIKVKGGFSLGYSYEMPLSDNTGVNLASHEFQLTFSFGKRNAKRFTHATFVNSVKPAKPEVKKKDPVIVPVVVQDSVATTPPDVLPQEPTEIIMIPIQPDTTERPVIDLLQPQEGEPVEPTPIEPEPIVQPVEPVQDELGAGPKVVARKGYHPFEMASGDYVVVAAFGEFKNAVGYNDELLTKGYASDFGFNTDKKLFYVYTYYGTDADEARRKRNELQESEEFKNAWYLLIK